MRTLYTVQKKSNIEKSLGQGAGACYTCMLRLALVPRVQGGAGHALAGSPERLGVLFGCAVLSRKWSCENSGQLGVLFHARGVARKMPRRRAARVAPLRRRFPMMAASPPSRQSGLAFGCNVLADIQRKSSAGLLPSLDQVHRRVCGLRRTSNRT